MVVAMVPGTCKTLPQGSKCLNMRYLPKTIVSFPNIEILNALWLGTLDPWGCTMGTWPANMEALRVTTCSRALFELSWVVAGQHPSYNIVCPCF